MEYKYLITGVRGLVGRHAVEVLLSKGIPPESIVGVSRKAKDDNDLQSLGIKLLNLDISQAKTYDILPHDITHVLHIAAITDDTPNHLVENVNYHGSLILAEWAQKIGVKKFGFVSSVSVYGLNQSLPIHEDSPTRPDRFYGWSKLRAEKGLMKPSYDYQVVILRPPYITGKYDEKFVGKFVQRIRKRKLPVIGSGNNLLSFVHAKDVIYAFLYLFENTTHNDVYNIVSFNATYNEFFKRLSEGLGEMYPQKKYPYWFGYFIGWASEIALKIQGKDTGTQVSRYRIKSFFKDRYFSTEKITRQGFKPRFDLDKTIKELLDYFRA